MSLAPRAAPARRFVDLLQQLRDSSELHRLRLADQIHAELERMCAPGDDHAEMALVASALEEGVLAELHGSDGRPTELVALQTLKALGYPGLAVLERAGRSALAHPDRGGGGRRRHPRERVQRVRRGQQRRRPAAGLLRVADQLSAGVTRTSRRPRGWSGWRG
jgi:hypothetical protein